MDHIDVEAATLPASAARDLVFAEDNGAQDHHNTQEHHNSYSLIPTPTGDAKQHEPLHRIAQAITDRLLRCLKVLVQDELHNSDEPLELLAPASSEIDAIAGAKESISKSQAELDVGNESRGKEEDWRNRPRHKQISSETPQGRVNALHIEDINKRIQGKDEHNAPQDPNRSRKPALEYTRRVEEMTQEEIEIENGSRCSSREKWRVGQDLGYLEDPWKHLWRRNRNDAEPLFRRCTDEERKGLQLDLIDALYFVPNTRDFALIPWRGLHTLSCWAMRHSPIVFDAGREPFLAVSDLNLKDLQEIGRLQIQWTSYWDEHLEVETKRSVSVLKLYWFPTGLSEILSTTGLSGGIEEEDRKQRMEEILLTLNLLLTSKSDPKDLPRRYGQIEAPSWLKLLAHDKLKDTWKPEQDLDTNSKPCRPLSRFWHDDPEMTNFCYEMTDHLSLPWPDSRDFRRVTYAEYPIYYQRLRNLRYYMDAQQPDGLRALWRDSRNSNAYYTFWIAFGFGVSSILLAFLALAAAIVQAYSQVAS
ncbi:MAG: hypothetical protein L6R42_006008 [Xanthoria sp. 1 TBL-2021]|nr:MAG: hypothetical protein L6R42_006008 [Xanthoria sp. 1 TBL-2021]